MVDQSRIHPYSPYAEPQKHPVLESTIGPLAEWKLQEQMELREKYKTQREAIAADHPHAPTYQEYDWDQAFEDNAISDGGILPVRYYRPQLPYSKAHTLHYNLKTKEYERIGRTFDQQLQDSVNGTADRYSPFQVPFAEPRTPGAQRTAGLASSPYDMNSVSDDMRQTGAAEAKVLRSVVGGLRIAAQGSLDVFVNAPSVAAGAWMASVFASSLDQADLDGEDIEELSRDPAKMQARLQAHAPEIEKSWGQHVDRLWEQRAQLPKVEPMDLAEQITMDVIGLLGSAGVGLKVLNGVRLNPEKWNIFMRGAAAFTRFGGAAVLGEEIFAKGGGTKGNLSTLLSDMGYNNELIEYLDSTNATSDEDMAIRNGIEAIVLGGLVMGGVVMGSAAYRIAKNLPAHLDLLKPHPIGPAGQRGYITLPGVEAMEKYSQRDLLEMPGGARTPRHIAMTEAQREQRGMITATDTPAEKAHWKVIFDSPADLRELHEMVPSARLDAKGNLQVHVQDAANLERYVEDTLVVERDQGIRLPPSFHKGDYIRRDALTRIAELTQFGAPAIGRAGHGMPEELLVFGTGERPTTPVPQAFTAENSEQIIKNIDTVKANHPEALLSEENWLKMEQEAFGGEVLPLPPRTAIAYAQNPQLLADKLNSMPSALRAGVDEGFAHIDKIANLYKTGVATPSETGRLFAWGFLSRMVTPAYQEAAFLDMFPHMDEFINAAMKGQFDDAMAERWLSMVNERIPEGSPGRMAIGNARELARFFRATGGPDAGSPSPLRQLHDMLVKGTPDAEIRRKFFELTQGAGESAGIDSKVVSFVLLASGRKGSIPVDRVQVRHLFGGDDFKEATGTTNIYGGLKFPVGDPELRFSKESEQAVAEAIARQTDESGNVVSGARNLEPRVAPDLLALTPMKPRLGGVANLMNGPRAVLLNEQIEEGLLPAVNTAYALAGRADEASIGRFHWDTWVMDSNQVVAHDTLALIHTPSKQGVGVTHGKLGEYSYGSRYVAEGPINRFEVTDSKGNVFTMSREEHMDYLEHIKKAKNGIIPKGIFNVGENADGTARTKPWYEDPRVNRDKLDESVSQFGHRRSDAGADEGWSADRLANLERAGAAVQRAFQRGHAGDGNYVPPYRRSRGTSEGSGGVHQRLVTPDGAEFRAIETFQIQDQAFKRELNQLGADTPNWAETPDIDTFIKAIETAKTNNPKTGDLVHVYKPDEYRKMRLFLSEDGTAGFAIKDGDVVSGFNDPKGPNKATMPSMLALARQLGATHADAFDIGLPAMYKRLGLIEYKREPWNDAHAPENWNYKKYGRPDIVYMSFNGKAP